MVCMYHNCLTIYLLKYIWADSNIWLQSVSQVSRSIVSDSLGPHELQRVRLPCPSSTPGACSNSCTLSRWCHPTISSSVVPFSYCLQSFPASGSFPMSQFFESGSQSIGASTSASVLLMNIQDWFPLGLMGLISLQSKRLSRVFSNTTVQKRPYGLQPDRLLCPWDLPGKNTGVGCHALLQHLAYILFICIINKAAMNIHVQPCVCVNMFFFPLG